jgi:hypothetical protein
MLRAMLVATSSTLSSDQCAAAGRFMSNVVGYAIIALGCVLIGDVIAVYTHIVLPIMAPPGTVANFVLFSAICCISFLVVFNYMSAMSLSGGTLPTREEWCAVGTGRGMRICQSCRVLKAPRAHHCGMCGVCVPKMDHHCPWINSCVGNSNQRYFFMFLLSLLVGTLFCGGQIAYALWVEKEPLHREVLESTLVVFTMVLCGAIFIAMCFFVGWYLFLMLTNQTAIEFQINRTYASGGRSRTFLGKDLPVRTPYDLGRWRNVLEVFATEGDAVLLRFQDRGPSGLVRMVLVVLWAVLPTWAPLANDGTTYRRWDDDIV